MQSPETQLVTTELASLTKEAPQVAEALGKIEQLTATLPAYDDRQKAVSIITSTAEYETLGQVLSQVIAASKQGAAYLSPFEILVGRIADFLRTARQKHTNRCTMIEGVIRGKLKVWEKKVEEEKKQVAAEQAKLDKKAEKTGEPAGTVQPNIRTTAISGYRKSTRYWVEVEDREKFLRAYRSAPKDFDEYLTINVQKLSNDWRECKDPEDTIMKRLAKSGLKLCKD